MKKNYMIELEIPPASRELLDFEKSVSLVKADCFLQTVDGLQKIQLHAELKVTFLNPNEEVKQQEQNAEVIENYYRVKSSEVLTKARKMAEKGKFKKAQKILDIMISMIKLLQKSLRS